MTAVGRRSYLSFSLAVKEDGVITALEGQLRSEVKGKKKPQMMRFKNPWPKQQESKLTVYLCKSYD